MHNSEKCIIPDCWKSNNDIISEYDLLNEIPEKMKSKIMNHLSKCNARKCVFFDFINEPLNY